MLPAKGTARDRVVVTATEMKNGFSRMLDEVARGRDVIVSKHDEPRAVLISFEEYEALTVSPESDLDLLTEEFDGVLAAMQTRPAAAAMKAAFHATPAEIGRAAVAAARKRRGA